MRTHLSVPGLRAAAGLALASTAIGAEPTTGPAADGAGIPWGPIIGGLAAAVTVIGAVVKLTQHYAKLQAQLERGELESQHRRLKERLADVEARYQSVLQGGSAAMLKKNEIDAGLTTIATAVNATASSLLVPSPSTVPDAPVSDFVFLCIDGPAAAKLRGTRVPMSSLAGHVYQTRQARITHDPRNNATPSFTAATDAVSKFDTTEMLAIPLTHAGKCVGVAEFLNKAGDDAAAGGRFDDADRTLATRVSDTLAAKVAAFTADPENLRLLGITPRQRAQEGTVLFCDLTRSSALFDAVDPAVAIDTINEYFEAVCDVGMSHGGTVDKFIGDGVMITFNVHRPVPDHAGKAVAAAFDMLGRFRSLKHKWREFRIPTADALFHRVGIATGPLLKAEMGHPQYRQLTVMGGPVNTAAALCDQAARDRDIILVDAAVRDVLGPTLTASEARDIARRKQGEYKAFELTLRPA